jgi:hypothetical protein
MSKCWPETTNTLLQRRLRILPLIGRHSVRQNEARPENWADAA